MGESMQVREKAKYRYKLQNDVNIYTRHSKHKIKDCMHK